MGHYTTLRSLVRNLVDVHIGDPDVVFTDASEILDRINSLESDIRECVDLAEHDYEESKDQEVQDQGEV